MPSGAKRRKAAKKKKENQYNNNHSNPSSDSTHSLGDDDVKHQDDKGSDVGEVSSPGSQDHHSQHNLLTEGEEEEEEEIEVVNNISNPPSEGVVGNPNIAVEESVVVPVEREFTAKDEFDKKDGGFEHDESARKSYGGGSSGSSSSSSSSSDDESHGVKGGEGVTDISPIVDSVKVDESLSIGQAENTNGTTIEEATCSVVESVNTPGEKAEVDESCSANTSVVESVFKENGVNNLSSIEYKAGTSEAFKDVVASQAEEPINPSNGIAAIPDQKECAAQENDDRWSLSYNAPPLTTSDKGADAEKNSGVKEPLLVPTPHQVQTTSWKSCCGLFELFTGSGR